MSCDLVVRNGSVLVGGRWEPWDVGVRDGRIAHLGPRLAPGGDSVDATGALVVPGLVDLHTHVYWGAVRLGVNPDKNAAVSGVTTWVDAGSAGAGSVEGLLRHVVDRSRVRVLPFLNVSYIGLAPAGMLTNEVGELWDPAYADLRAILRVAEEHPGVIAGIKLRASANAIGANAPVVLPIAREAADELGVPLMVHIGMAPPTIEEVLPYLRDGDVLTHCFHPHAGGRLLDGRGRVRAPVREAVARGVRLDVGHGVASASHAVALAALEQGLRPDTISSDLHSENVGAVLPSLLTVLEMFLALGMSLEDVLHRATAAPAAVLGRPSLGTLAVGGPADLAVLAVTACERTKQDSVGHRLAIRQALEHRATVVAGRRLEPFDDGRPESHASAWATRFGGGQE